MENPFISVIIPVYNASLTIERCVNSIIAHKSIIEIICVDDGSEDGSLDVLNKISETDDRLLIVHQNNAGAGAARNTGIEHARGKYIMFCDADDTFLPTTIDYIIEDIEKHTPDYIAFHRKTIMTDGGEQLWGKGEEIGFLSCDSVGYLNRIMMERTHCGVVVNKVFRRDIIANNNIRFHSFRFCEDFLFIVTYILKAKTFFQDYHAYYLQYSTTGSICQSRYDDYLGLNMEWVDTFKYENRREYEKLMPFFSQYYYGTIVWSIARVLNGIDAKKYKEKLVLLKELFRKETNNLYLTYLLEHNLVNKQCRRNCLDILEKRYVYYAFRNFYIPRCKQIIIKTILRK